MLRFGVLGGGTVLGGGMLAGCSSPPAAATPSPSATGDPATPTEALAVLKAGNQRFVSGHPENAGRDSVRRAATAEAQSPYAVLVSCADSRVVPEVLFDTGLGDLFLVRVAGNTATAPILLGSIEFAVAVLGAKLIVVLGHENCGAVKAAVANVTKGATVPGSMPAFVEPILAAAQSVQSEPADEQVDAAIRANAQLQASALPENSSILAAAVQEHQLEVVSAVYQLASGKVAFL